MSSLRDAAAGLVSKLRAQHLVQTRGLELEREERLKLWFGIDRDAERLMLSVQELEVVIGPLEDYAGLVKQRSPIPKPEDVAAAATAVVHAIEAFAAVPAPDPPRPAAGPDGWARAADVQLPLGDREDPPTGGNPPP